MCRTILLVIFLESLFTFLVLHLLASSVSRLPKLGHVLDGNCVVFGEAPGLISQYLREKKGCDVEVRIVRTMTKEQ